MEAAHEATGGGTQQLRVTLETPLCSRVLDVREAHELLYEHALKKLWLPGTMTKAEARTNLLKWEVAIGVESSRAFSWNQSV